MIGEKRPAADSALTDAAAAAGGGKRSRMTHSIDEYEIKSGLGKGAFGAVVRARHRATGKDVAIKSLHRAPAAAGDSRGLLREALWLARFRRHPSIVHLHGYAHDPRTGHSCLVLELLGPSLSRLLRHRRRHLAAGGAFTDDETRRVMRHLLEAVKTLHEGRIVHRDIKPGNILIAGDDEVNGDLAVVKLCDFGLAMCTAWKPPYQKSGTPGYMAPEILLGKPDYDELVDEWSLGCVMADLLTGGGVPLFQGHSETEQLLKIFRALGVPNSDTWPSYMSMPVARSLPLPRIWDRNRLREMFPEKRISPEGFEVLDGLLTCDPGKRLSAAAALRLPWFVHDGVAAVDALRRICQPVSPRKEPAAAAASFAAAFPCGAGRCAGVAG
uniref:[RNA-polymerase]-subunit kinase n=1 Tax=Leersia perrieri TaxID=77586 RepID=A0A0D9WTK8_9ORYZ